MAEPNQGSGGSSLPSAGSINSSLGAYSGKSVSSSSPTTSGSSGGGRLACPTDLTVDLDEYVADEVEYESTPGDFNEAVIKVLRDITNSDVAKVFNTADMFMLSLNDGALRLTEKIGDGAIWSTKATADIYLYLGGKVLSLIDPRYEAASDQIKGDVDGFFTDVIAFEADDWVHDQIMSTGYFQNKNENSFLDYNSETSNTIAGVSEWIQTRVGAALSSKVWGGALAILLGGCYGSGEQAETLYKDHKDTTLAEELSILVSGVNSAIDWYSFGQMFKGLTGAAKSASSGASIGELGKELGKNAMSDLKGTNSAIVKAFKSYFTSAHNPFSKYLGQFMSNPTNVMRINLALFDHLDEYLAGEKDVTVTSVWGDINNSFSKMIIGSLRTDIIENAASGATEDMPSYTAVPVQGALMLVNKLTEYLGLGTEKIESSITDDSELTEIEHNDGSTDSQ